jgi:flagellar protein FlbD
VITITRLNGKPLVVNAELIRTVESTPDTMIKLINGDTILVKESMPDVVEKAIDYGRSLRKLIPPS